MAPVVADANAARYIVAVGREEVVVIDGGVPLVADEPGDGERRGREAAEDVDEELFVGRAVVNPVSVVDRVHRRSDSGRTWWWNFGVDLVFVVPPWIRWASLN
jgi:hypothetical protein